MKKWVLRLVAALVTFVIFSAYELLGEYVGKGPGGSGVLAAALRFAVSATLAVACYLAIRGERLFDGRLDFSRRTKVITFLPWLAFLALYVVCGTFWNWADVMGLEKGRILSCLLVAGAAALFEELLVRGLILSALMEAFEKSPHRLLAAGTASALIFGLVHYLNLLFSPLEAVNQQVFYAGAMGMVFVALRIRHQRLWPLILIHLGFDFQPMILESGGGGSSWAFLLMVFIPTALIGAAALHAMDKDCHGQESLNT